MKTKGDIYEKYIGSNFESKDELVIYNGLIRGYKDGGVDIVSICKSDNIINLIQCKNWTNKPLLMNDIIQIYEKLDNYTLDFIHLNADDINRYLISEKDKSYIDNTLRHIQQYSYKYAVRKTLYISSDKVVDLNIGKQLIMVKSNIFKYNDMKIVVKKIK